MAERVLMAAIRCGTVVAVSLILPAWVTAVPLLFLAGASSVAIVRRPCLAVRAIDALRSVLCCDISTQVSCCSRRRSRAEILEDPTHDRDY
jgi:hypothetical protein